MWSSIYEKCPSTLFLMLVHFKQLWHFYANQERVNRIWHQWATCKIRKRKFYDTSGPGKRHLTVYGTSRLHGKKSKMNVIFIFVFILSLVFVFRLIFLFAFYLFVPFFLLFSFSFFCFFCFWIYFCYCFHFRFCSSFCFRFHFTFVFFLFFLVFVSFIDFFYFYFSRFYF